MAKLNKQEVHAIASKLHRDLEKSAQEKRVRAIANYTPSEEYTKIHSLLSERDDMNAQIQALRTRMDEVEKEAEAELRNSYGMYWMAHKETDIVMNKIIDHECQLQEVPDVDELKDEVTIAAIDDSFDTAAFIDEQLAKFQ